MVVLLNPLMTMVVLHYYLISLGSTFWEDGFHLTSNLFISKLNGDVTNWTVIRNMTDDVGPIRPFRNRRCQHVCTRPRHGPVDADIRRGFMSYRDGSFGSGAGSVFTACVERERATRFDDCPHKGPWGYLTVLVIWVFVGLSPGEFHSQDLELDSCRVLQVESNPLRIAHDNLREGDRLSQRSDDMCLKKGAAVLFRSATARKRVVNG